MDKTIWARNLYIRPNQSSQTKLLLLYIEINSGKYGQWDTAYLFQPIKSLQFLRQRIREHAFNDTPLPADIYIVVSL